MLAIWQACVQCEHAARERVCLEFGRRVCTANVLRMAKYRAMCVLVCHRRAKHGV